MITSFGGPSVKFSSGPHWGLPSPRSSDPLSNSPTWASANLSGPRTSLAVIPSLSWGRATMQKTVIPTLTRCTVTWPDVCDNVIRVSLRCGESVVNWPFAAIYRLSSVLAITRRSIDTVSCSNYCQLMCSKNVPFSCFFVAATQTYSHVEYVCVRSWTLQFTTFSSQRAVMLWHPRL